MKKLKAKHKLIFFLSLFLVLFIGCRFIPSAVAQDEGDSGRVLSNHILFSADVADSDSQSLNNPIGLDDDNVRIVPHKLGIADFYSSDIRFLYQGETHAILESYITLYVAVDVWTDYNLNELYHNIESDSESFMWLMLMLDDTWAEGEGDDRYYYPHEVTYTDYDFTPDENGDYIRAKGIDADVELSFDILPFDTTIMSGENEDGDSIDVAFSVPLIEAISARKVNASSSHIDDYDTYFIGEFGQTTVTLNSFGRSLPERSSAWGDANTPEIEEEVEGECDGGEQPSGFGVYAKYPYTEPYAFHDLYLGQQGEAIEWTGDLSGFNYQVTNIPDIKVFKQQIGRQKINIGVDTKTPWAYFPAKNTYAGIKYIVSDPTDDVTVEVGYTVKNYNVRDAFEITFKINTMLECDNIEFMDELLSTPTIYKEDVYWNIALTGATSADIFLQENFWATFWENRGTQVRWIMITAIIVGGVALTFFIKTKTPMGRGGGSAGIGGIKGYNIKSIELEKKRSLFRRIGDRIAERRAKKKGKPIPKTVINTNNLTTSVKRNSLKIKELKKPDRVTKNNLYS